MAACLISFDLKAELLLAIAAFSALGSKIGSDIAQKLWPTLEHSQILSTNLYDLPGSVWAFHTKPQAWSTHQPGSLSSKPVLSGDGQRTIETEPDGGDVASSGGTSSPKVLDLLDADDAQEETGFTQDEFSGELSCLLSKEEKAEQEEDKENV
ncbi:hypothetical protein BY996DRAFT_6411408 [Phakopsora pachyrhizi]|nr:hypothetical protein BY996DRAFT_6411408 [Phakopsora pachyrhizi]